MTDPKTLARTENPQTSKDAAEKMVKSGELSRQEQEILNTIESISGSAMKSFDFTTKDIAARLQIRYPYHKAYDICRKRFSGLATKGKIERIQRYVLIGETEYKVAIASSGKPAWERRDGCCIWKLL